MDYRTISYEDFNETNVPIKHIDKALRRLDCRAKKDDRWTDVCKHLRKKQKLLDKESHDFNSNIGGEICDFMELHKRFTAELAQHQETNWSMYFFIRPTRIEEKHFYAKDVEMFLELALDDKIHFGEEEDAIFGARTALQFRGEEIAAWRSVALQSPIVFLCYTK
jgi:hypothetical protein